MTLSINNNTIKQEKGVAEILNNQFNNICRNIIKGINPAKHLKCRQTNNCSSLFCTSITNQKVLRNIQKLKGTASPGNDIITAINEDVDM